MSNGVPAQLTFQLPDFGLLTDGTSLPPPRPRRIYCNRNLRMDQIEMIGFDMDYTLAIYKQDEMDKLSIEATTKKLVERGYPESFLSMPYRTDFPIRGLLIDKKLGNILKMDRYRYVKKAFHGMKELSRDERRSLYHMKRLRPDSGRYHWVDTLYALSEVAVFAAAVDELEKQGADCDFTQLFTDVRTCIDLAHQDGSILDTVYSHLPRYVIRDPDLPATLHKLRSAGKRLFLLTNSRAKHTDQMMTYLLGGARIEYPSWRHYFDIAITTAGKPNFFMQLSPHMEVMEDGSTRPTAIFERGRLYAGGSIEEFERFTGVAGDRILYIGDHIYGDVLRAKKESAWRTAMIIQEMSEELVIQDRIQNDLVRLDTLFQIRANLQEEIGYRQNQLRDIQRRLEMNASLHVPAAPPPDDLVELQPARIRHRRALERIRHKLKAVETEYGELEERIDHAFHPFWGSLFKVAREVSIFGNQVEQYACLYTDRVTNFLMYSPTHYFRSPPNRMPHEK